MQKNQMGRWATLPKLTATLSLGLLVATQVATADVVTEPVGFYQLPVNQVSGGISALALPLQRMRADQGLISGVTSNVLTLNCASCSASNYGNPTVLNYVQ